MITKKDINIRLYDEDPHVASFICDTLSKQIDCKMESVEELYLLLERAVTAFDNIAIHSQSK